MSGILLLELKNELDKSCVSLCPLLSCIPFLYPLDVTCQETASVSVSPHAEYFMFALVFTVKI